jgi:D-glycero-alpha-D-manno-heptose-7-phosphate kinase
MIITQTPLRISLLGGGTDFPEFYEEHDGCVLTTAIDKYVYCIVKERFDDDIYINYSSKEVVNDVNKIKHQLVRESMKKLGIKGGIEISFLADIPAKGSGLGSSSSVAVGVLKALYLYKGISVSSEKIAKDACEVEIEILRRPMGVQDQYIAAYGGVRFMEFNNSGIFVESVKLSKEQLRDFESHLMVFFTGITRNSESVLKEQRKNIHKNFPILNKMVSISEEGKSYLEAEDYEGLGKLIHKSWLVKKKYASNISNSRIDGMYRKALKAGAVGGKISGAGNGGFLTLIVSPDKKKKVRQALSSYREISVGFSLDGSKSILNIRR